MKPFDQAQYTRIILKKLSGTKLTEEENAYMNIHLLSDDPGIRAQCQEILSTQIDNYSAQNPKDPTEDLDIDQEYVVVLDNIKRKKASKRRFIILMLIIFVLSLVTAFILFY
jgi:hypothetical protein